MALAYVLLAPPVYQAEVHFLPPTVKDIYALNIQVQSTTVDNIGDDQNITVESVYEAYEQALGSKKLQRKFVEGHPIGAEIDKAFDNDLSLTQLDEALSRLFGVITNKRDPHMLSLMVQWSNPEMAARTANGYAQMVNREVTHQLASDAKNEIAGHIRYLENRISSKLKSMQHQRKARIANLEGAIEIAVNLGIVDRIETDRSEIPLYYHGQKALQAEKAILEKGKNSDSFVSDLFISELHDLQEKLALFKSIQIDEKTLRAATVDREAYPPDRRIKPKRWLIMILGVVFGLMLGIFAAFFRNFLENLPDESVPANN